MATRNTIKIKVSATQEFFNQPIEVLDLNNRSFNGLKRGRINTLEELTDRWSTLEKINKLGVGSIKEIRNKFISYYITEYLNERPGRTEEFLEELAA
jgi:DNA-directed RNA polymerase alpha subunit